MQGLEPKSQKWKLPSTTSLTAGVVGASQLSTNLTLDPRYSPIIPRYH